MPRHVLFAFLFLLVIACGSSADSEDPSASPPPAAPVGDPLDPTNRGWIGGACAGTTDCPYDGGVCLLAIDGFPGGLCSQKCESRCPDRDGTSMTFCVADRGGSGTCVSRCDFTKIPGSGCRSGYGCARVSRMGDPDTIVDACMPLGTDGRARPLNDLQPELERAVRAADIETERVVLMDVTESRPVMTAAVRPMDPVYPASVIKVVVMAEVEHQIEQGVLQRKQRFTIDEEQETCTGLPDGDTRPVLDAGDWAEVDFLVDVMITRSDNTATNVLVDRVARHKANAFMSSLGLPTLQVHRKTFGCTPYTDSGWDGVHVNTMTALETAKLYRLILDGGPGFVGPAGRKRMQEVLGGQLLRGGVASRLPDDAQYLSKTGNTSEVLHDSGIILWRGQRYILAAFLEQEPDVGRPKLKELGAQVARIMEKR